MATERGEGGLNPVNINENVWYYEGHKTLEFIVECRDGENNFHQVIRFRVPARKLQASLRRMAKYLRKRGA